MADLGNGGNHLEAELRELDGVAGAFVLRDAARQPVEIQIFSRSGSSAARIRKAAADILSKKGHELSPDAISVFELAADSPAGRWVIASSFPGAASAASGTAAAAEETSAAPTILPPPRPGIPVASLLTTLLAIAGLLLLLTAPWVALTRLISEPLETASTVPGPSMTRSEGGRGAALDQSPITVTLEPTPPVNEALAVGPPPARPRTTPRARPPVALTTSSGAAGVPLIVAAPLPVPSPTVTPPAISPGGSGGSGGTGGAGPRGGITSTAQVSDEDGDGDDDSDERRRKRRGPKIAGFIHLPPGHERHHDRTRNGKASGLDKHRHLTRHRDDHENDEDDAQ